MDESDLVDRIKQGQGQLVRFNRSAMLNTFGMMLILEELQAKVDGFCTKHGFKWRYDQKTQEFRFSA